MAGFDTAANVYDVWPGVGQFGRPLFWIRYFTPAQENVIDQGSAHANAECAAIWDSNSGSPKLGPVSYPWQPRLDGSQAEGQADAQAFISAMWAVFTEVGPLYMPSDEKLLCWLDLEAAFPLSGPYWTGWSEYIAYFNWANDRKYPLYPALYCNPYAEAPNCSTVAHNGVCSAIWSSAPPACGYDLNSTPPWNAESCPSHVTHLWQFATEGYCYSIEWPDNAVDLDMNRPDMAYGTWCWYLHSKPYLA